MKEYVVTFQIMNTGETVKLPFYYNQSSHSTLETTAKQYIYDYLESKSIKRALFNIINITPVVD